MEFIYAFRKNHSVSPFQPSTQLGAIFFPFQIWKCMRTFQSMKMQFRNCLAQYNCVDQRARARVWERDTLTRIRNKCLTILKQFNGHFASALWNSWLWSNRLNCILKFNNNACDVQMASIHIIYWPMTGTRFFFHFFFGVESFLSFWFYCHCQCTYCICSRNGNTKKFKTKRNGMETHSNPKTRGYIVAVPHTPKKNNNNTDLTYGPVLFCTRKRVDKSNQRIWHHIR